MRDTRHARALRLQQTMNQLYRPNCIQRLLNGTWWDARRGVRNARMLPTYLSRYLGLPGLNECGPYRKCQEDEAITDLSRRHPKPDWEFNSTKRASFVFPHCTSLMTPIFGWAIISLFKTALPSFYLRLRD